MHGWAAGGGDTHARLKSGRSSGNDGWGAALSPSTVVMEKALGRNALRSAAKVPMTSGGIEIIKTDTPRSEKKGAKPAYIDGGMSEGSDGSMGEGGA